jgi:hypothetical protein
VPATIAFNLTRAAGALAPDFHAKATTATIRAQLIAVPARLALHPKGAPAPTPRLVLGEQAWAQIFDATCGPPTAA